jgi:mRNA interferase MazF
VQRGEIRWYRFARSDKRRPVLVLTRQPALEFLHDITVAPVTSTVRDVPSEVILDEADGMPSACAINLYHVQTIPKAHVGTLITTLSHSRMLEVRSALLFALGFD